MVEEEKIYWNSKGAHQMKYNVLYRNYVPSVGECEDERFEAFRMMSKLYYDWYNNGFGNYYDNYMKYGEEVLEFIKEKNLTMLDDNKFIKFIKKANSKNTNENYFYDNIGRIIKIKKYESDLEVAMNVIINETFKIHKNKFFGGTE